MSDLNPYAPPQTNPEPPRTPENAVLATPFERLGAAILDALILMAVIIPLEWVTGFIGRAGRGFSVSFLAEQIVWSAVGLGVWAAVNWTALQNGQTIGKRVAKLRIVRKDGSPIPAVRIITHRMLPVQVAAIIPVVGSILVLIDSLLIFRRARNTLHDDIADTKVIRV